jgi:hypothetical protein
MKNARLLLVLVISLYALASPAHALVLRACDVENPPVHCESMWAVVAHVSLPKQSATTVNPTPRCGSRFESIDWGKIVADAFAAEVTPERLKNLAMDVSDAFQKKLIPQITGHIRGDAASFVEDGFSKMTPKAWSPSVNLHDQALCAPVIAIIPVIATVRVFRFQAYGEKFGYMDCTESNECSVGFCRFVHGWGPPQKTSLSGVTVYTAIFQSWSTDSPRVGRLIIFFEMPPGKLPMQQM